MIRKLGYWRRIGQAYLAGGRSNLTFWHETPTVNPHALFDRLGPYYMTFSDKADYPGPFDAAGVPQLDYRGGIGVQYNPIAIAQYGLAHYNRGTEASNALCLKQADWLASSLERNGHGLKVWLHHFDFDYRTILRAPWYSALAQGQGVSLLARARLIAPSPGKAAAYEEAMRAAYEEAARENRKRLELHADLLMIHDPQPAARAFRLVPEANIDAAAGGAAYGVLMLVVAAVSW